MGVVVSGATPGYLGAYGEKAKDRLRLWASGHGWDFFWGESFDGSRPPAWSKIRFLQALAPHHERLLWVDADVIATLKGPPPEEVFVGGLVPSQQWPHQLVEAHVFAAEDENGLNTGVMGLRGQCEGTERILGFVWDSTDYLHHPYWEQAALQEFHQFAPDHFRIIDKKTWNAYPGEEGPDTALIHFPGPEHKKQFDSYAARYLGRSDC